VPGAIRSLVKLEFLAFPAKLIQNMSTAPFSLPFDLATLSERGEEFVIALDPAERGAVAAWLGTLGVDRLEATIRLIRESDESFSYAADFLADVVQACVVTLDPVPAHLSGEVKRRYRIMAKLPLRRRDQPTSVELSESDDDTEILSETEVDLAAPLLEELSLNLDPYPRAPGVAFEPPKEERTPADSPFAVLAKLKEGGPAAQPPPAQPKEKPPKN